MSLHHNARSCPHSRALMVDRIQRGDPVVRVEAEFGSEPADRLYVVGPLLSARV